MKKILALLLVVVLTATVSISGTLAFYQANAAPMNTEASGPIHIDQKIYYRAFNSGEGTQTCSLNERQSGETFLLYPAVYTDSTPPTESVSCADVGTVSMYAAPNVCDEIVVVTNEGDKPAYLRTWIAIECGNAAPETFKALITLNKNETDWSWEDYCSANNSPIHKIGGKNYYVYLATYNTELNANTTTPPSLLQIMLNKEAGNSECLTLDPDGDGLAVHILTQAALAENTDTSKPSSLDEIKKGLNEIFNNQLPGSWNPN